MIDLDAFLDELEKIADAKSALIGAGIGGALSTHGAGMREWDRRIQEDENPTLSAEEKMHRRRSRLKRFAAGVATGAAAGGAAGHFAGKGVKALTDHGHVFVQRATDVAAKGVKQGITDAVKELPAKKIGAEFVDGMADRAKEKALSPFKKIFGKKPKKK